MKVINLYGGPGTGKSTTAASVFALMKHRGYKVELVTEYAKDLTYDHALDVLKDQLYVTAVQDHRLERLRDQVDWAITDSPLPIGLCYASGPRWGSPWFESFVWSLFDTYDNHNVLLHRVKPYQTFGRTQTEDQARALDGAIRDLLGSRVDHVVPADGDAPKRILERLGL